MLFYLIRIELIQVEITDYCIFKYNLLGKAKQYYFSEFDGYKIASLKGYEHLFLIKEGKRVVQISQIHHRNYNALKIELIKHSINFLGNEYVGFISIIKDTFERE